MTAATYKALPRSPHRRRGEEPFDLPPMLGEVPGRPGRAVRRHALLAALRDEHAARVTLITAPAGSGKTTLMRQWAHENPRPVTTASVQQVRRPINRDGIGSAKAFREFLEPFSKAHYG